MRILLFYVITIALTLKLFILFLNVCVYAHMHTNFLRGQKRIWDSTRLEIQPVVNHSKGALRTKLRSSEIAGGALICFCFLSLQPQEKHFTELILSGSERGGTNLLPNEEV